MYKVVMIPTFGDANLLLGLSKEGKLIRYRDAKIENDKFCCKYHLYIVSDDKIDIGDFYIDSLGSVCKCGMDQPIHWKDLKVSKNIVASTDTLEKTVFVLGMKSIKKVKIPAIPNDFIDIFVNNYNKGNIIEEVDINFLEEPTTDGDYERYTEIEITNPKFNISKPLKIIRDETEMKNLLFIAYTAREKLYGKKFDEKYTREFNDWFENAKDLIYA